MKTLLNSLLARFTESRSSKTGVESCPRCQTTMEQDSIHAMKVCPDCNGLWMVPCLVKLILTSNEQSVRHLLVGEVKTELTHEPNPGRTCPTCRSIMKNYRFMEDSSLWLDACPRGCGVWFDSGELQLARRHKA